MSNRIVLKNATVVNRMKTEVCDILIEDGRIVKKAPQIDDANAQECNMEGYHVLPGVIDDQVHFREPGLTHKANIYTESRAAVAGGVTTFMEMPNTKPPALSQEALEEKYNIGAATSLANYSFYMGISNGNLDEALKTNRNTVCGLKAFMGSSTGNMLVDNPTTLNNLFKNAHMLIATHCEDEETIKGNMTEYIERYGDDIPAKMHPLIRSEEGCYISSSLAADLANKYNARLHILHISTAKELSLFSNDIHRSKKNITSEACVHHLTLNDTYYDQLGNLMKCNPAIKKESDRAAIFQAMKDGVIDVIATDHAPHTKKEKDNLYISSPSGLPLIEHSLPIMLDWVHKGAMTLEEMVDKMCHAPADIFQVKDRGYLDEGMWADIAVVDLGSSQTIKNEEVRYKCGWSPFDGFKFTGKVVKTMVNGNWVYDNGQICEGVNGMRIGFDRD